MKDKEGSSIQNLLLIFFGGTSLFFYSKILSGFFQQDEWFGFSEFILRKGFGFARLFQYFFEPKVGHYTPLTISTLYLDLSIFGMNYVPHAIISLILHLGIIVLVYKMFRLLFEKKHLAGVATVVFASFASIYQATSWVMADIGTHGATILGILSTIFFLQFIKTKNQKKFTLSLITLLISLLFKEITIGLFVIFLLLLWKFSRFSKKDKILFTKKIVFWGTFYALLRFIMILITPKYSGTSEVVFGPKSILMFLYDLVTIPVKSISQSLIPAQILKGISGFIARLAPEKITGEFGSPAFEVFIVKRVMEGISLLASLVIFVWVLIKKNFSKYHLLGITWIIINSLIFAFSPQRSGIKSLIDSRNLYFVSIGMAMIIASVYSKVKEKNNIKATLLLILIIILNLFFLNQNISDFVKVSKQRRAILDKITFLFPSLPDRVIFYTKSSQSYYGLPPESKIMPFQSGFGQTLLVWYYPKEKIPKEFFKDRFLWDIDSQGYKETQDRGFGYFRDMNLLKEAIKQYNLSEESVVAFSWDGHRNQLEDISKIVVNEIYAQ